jgi:hypothetical protein
MRVTLVAVEPAATTFSVRLSSPSDQAEREVPISTLPLTLSLEGLNPGAYFVEAASSASNGMLEVRQFEGVRVRSQVVTELTVDLSRQVGGSEVCDGLDNDGNGQIDEATDTPLCVSCVDGGLSASNDDERCGAVSCERFNRFEVRGDLEPQSAAVCVRLAFPPLVANRCAGPLTCIEPTEAKCGLPSETIVARKGVCQRMRQCETGAPIVDNAPNGTPCGSDRVCEVGACVVPDAGQPDPVGCSDGSREGFVSFATFPAIAACAGGFSVPGVVVTTMPTCGRRSGNDGQNREGMGCSAADLCADGWHVCRGKEEVASRANGSCDGVVAQGAAPRSVFFAVAQNSANDTTCDRSGVSNDVFGCGNLGLALGPEKNCAPLTHALASTRADSCGVPEAEPTQGPWQCLGGASSHLSEGLLVTKRGCMGTSCVANGRSISNADKGGVLCCRD